MVTCLQSGSIHLYNINIIYELAILNSVLQVFLNLPVRQRTDVFLYRPQSARTERGYPCAFIVFVLV